MSELWHPLLLSLRIAGAATALGALIGIPLALFMSRCRFLGKSLLDALIIVPMVLTLPIFIYINYNDPHLFYATAAAVLALAAISLALTIAYNRSAASNQD